MKNLLPRARVVVRTSKMKISRHCLVDYVKTLHQKACGTCSTIIFLHLTNQNIDLWRCHCRRRLLNSLLSIPPVRATGLSGLRVKISVCAIIKQRSEIMP
mgnify:CR=1 FL=1